MNNIIKQATDRHMPNKEGIRINVMTSASPHRPLKAYAVLAAVMILAVCTMIAVPFMVNRPDTPPMHDCTEDIIPSETTVVGTEDINDTEPDDTAVPDDTTEPYMPDPDDPHAIGGTGPFCYIHDDSYHFFDARMIDYIGEERFMEWVENVEQPEGIDQRDETVCPYPNTNVYACIEYFGLSNDEIIEIYKMLYYDVHWDMESLLAKDFETFEAHMREIRNNQELQLNVFKKLKEECYIKLDIIKRIGEKEDKRSQEYYNKLKKVSVCDVTILEMVENSSLTREDLEDIIPRKPYIAGSYKIYYYVYNLDLLFEDREIYKAEIEKLDIPYYESEVKAIDALLHMETRLSITEEGKAVETEDGVYVPEDKLPLSVKENGELEEKFIVYNGNTYWLTEQIYTTEDEKVAMVDEHIGATRRDFLRQRYSWEVFTFNDLSSNIKGDVYSLREYDSSFRIALVPFDGNPYILIFESNKGMTLDKGKDILQLDGYTDVYIPYGKPLTEEAEKYLPEFTAELYDATFIIKDLGDREGITVKFEFADGTTTTLYLYEGGYVAYEHHLGYNVYLKVNDKMYNAINN